MNRLVSEAHKLVEQLDIALDRLYEEHPLLGFVARNGTGARRMRIRRIRARAERRWARRMIKAGTPPAINRGFAMWVVNSRDSSWF